ncbi:cupin domain-containing protein [Sphingobacteriales bacterium UPWRP_1]|nr:hypothetical protein B6N25_09245 [Sphingobacteriales bacterium TSM_CSS]PSJ77468.1 cupin domain-containing protein [Sphingobacteriales bacterium UPWRP_1]
MNNKFDITKQELEKLLATKENTPASSETEATEDALLALASDFALAPPPDLKSKILGKLSLLKNRASPHEKLDINNLPLLTEKADWFAWQEVVKGIEPPDDYDNIYLHTLELTEKRELSIVWVNEMVPEEVHHDLLESFLILEGSCECDITDAEGNTRKVRLAEGDFITMPTGETHNIIITSAKPTKAILQWLKVA